jgi:hypothetical protein
VEFHSSESNLGSETSGFDPRSLCCSLFSFLRSFMAVNMEIDYPSESQPLRARDRIIRVKFRFFFNLQCFLLKKVKLSIT